MAGIMEAHKKEVYENEVREKEAVKLHDFIEVEYTGKLVDGTVFDTTQESVARKAGLYSENARYGSLVICVGEGQILPGIDTKVVDAVVGTLYTFTLTPEEAFGKRDIKKMRIVPLNTFREHNLMPQPGLQVDVDGEKGIISSISGGRVIVNFNHPLAGKEVVYDVKVMRKVVDVKEKIMCYISTTFRLKKEAVKVDVNAAEGKASIEVPFVLPQQFFDAMGKRFQEILGLNEVVISGKQVSGTGVQ